MSLPSGPDDARAALGADDVRAIARRAAGRAIADRARAHTDGSVSRGTPAVGVHASWAEAPVITPGSYDSASPLAAATRGQPPRVEPGVAAPKAREDRAVVTAAVLVGVPDGGRYIVEPGARITPLAEEEARRRGITFVAGRAAELLPRGVLRLAVASDHGGFALKRELVALAGELGHVAQDLGPASDAACDYPDFARAVAEAVADGRADLGIVVDGAGIGSAMAANKVPGVLAANCWDQRSARNAREHNHANVLTLGAGHLDLSAARAVLLAFLGTPPGGDRHARRVAKIHAIEREFARAPRRVDTFDPSR